LIPDSKFTSLSYNRDTSYAIKAQIGDTEIFSYDYTAPPYEADRPSVYETKFRIASVSKLYTVLAVVLSADQIGWEDSIKQYVPELQGDVWDDVKISALAGQTSGLGRFGYVGDLGVIPSFIPSQFGIPPVNETPPACDPFPGGRVCTYEEVIEMFNDPAELPHSPNSGPLYSNIAYNLLGLALEKVHGKSFEDVVKELIFDPLNLSKSTFTPPTDDTEAFLPVPGDRWFVSDFANYNPTGGIWSTPNDLMTFLRSILNHDLLSGPRTRWWLQPRSLLPSLHQLVGAPWEILRPDDSEITYARPIDIYTKSGGVDGYAGYGIVVPEYDLAVSINAAGNSSGRAVQAIMPIVMEALIPFADAHAREQAKANYAGTYTLPNSNNSITIALDDGPGLSITAFNMNGVPVLRSLAALLGQDFATFSARLYPTDPDSLGTAKEFWRISLDSTTTPETYADNACAAWLQLDRFRYIREPLDSFNFVIENGKPVAVELLGWRTTLRKRA
jgi:CubicO group peptidase (beta-lactamase class C family)